MSADEEQVTIVDNSSGKEVAKLPAGPAADTAYVLLSRTESGLWAEAEKVVYARSAEAAIRSLEAEGTYVAVPHRSWKPVTVKAEVTTVLKLEEAT